MSTRRFVQILWAVTVCLVLVTVIVMIVRGARDFGIDPESSVQRWIQLLTALTFASAGMVIVGRHPRHVIGWLFVAMGMATALAELSISYAASCAPTSCNVVALVAVDAVWFPTITVGLGGLFLLFPEGRLPRGWRLALWWALVVTGGLGAATAFLLEEVYLLSGATNPLSGLVDPTLVTALSDTVGVVVVALALVAVVDFIFRARMATGVTRLQNRWLAFSGMLIVLGAITSIVGEEIGAELGWAWSLATASIPAAVAFAITKNHLYDIDRIISRTVSYSVVVALLGLMVGLVAALVGSQFGEPPVVAATTLAVAALFNPVRRRVHGLVDRRFNRSRYDAERVISEFAGSLRERVDPDGLLEGWVGVVEETMQPASAGIWVREPR